MSHLLDRPVWNALRTEHAHLAEGGPFALRYPQSIVPFAAPAEYTPACHDALSGFATGGDIMALVEAGHLSVPPGFSILREGKLVQMIADQPGEPITDPRIERLGLDDAQAMLDLATLTRPGPFTLKAQSLGTFWGIKVDGHLIAMAGQRMRVTGYAELSGLCTHPDFQGHGLATLLFRYVAGVIAARGETAFLHVFEDNANAIRLYKYLGFRQRALMNLRIIQRNA